MAVQTENKCVTDALGNCSRWCNHPGAVPGQPALPYITGGESSQECLDKGLNCSIDPWTGRCTECGEEEKD